MLHMVVGTLTNHASKQVLSEVAGSLLAIK